MQINSFHIINKTLKKNNLIIILSLIMGIKKIIKMLIKKLTQCPKNQIIMRFKKNKSSNKIQRFCIKIYNNKNI